jgi:inner membrane protein
MDPLTHSLTGLCMSRAGFKRWCPRATAILLVAANAPDLDLVTAIGGQTSYLHYHRHLTHSLAMIPVMALLALLIVRLFSRGPFAWRRGYIAALAGAATHPLLDWTNIYGIRLLLPFSGEWFRLDITNVFDFCLWAALLLAVLAPLLSGLVSSEIGGRRGGGRGWAVFGLAFLLLYDGGRFVLHQRAVAVLDSRLYEGSVPARVAAFPGAANPLRWSGLAETREFYALVPVNLDNEFEPSSAQILYKPERNALNTRAESVASRTEPFRVFLDFSQFPYWSFSPVEDPDGGIRVEATDLRFAAPPPDRFVATALIAPDFRVLRAWFGFSRR